MQRITKLFLLVTALFAASALFARAGGAGFEHPAYQGLVPPWSGFSNDASTVSAETSAGLSRQPGLRLPYRGHGRGDDAFEIVGWSAGGFSLYSGTRMMQRLGSEYSQGFGGVRYPLSGTWSSTLEASLDLASPLSTRGYALLGQVHRLLPGGRDLSLGLQYSIYEPGADRLPTGLGDSWSALGQGLPLFPAAGGASATAGYELRLNLRYGERNTVGLTYGSGREFDTQQMLGVYPGDGRQFGVTGRHWLTPDWAISYGLMAQEQIGLRRGQGLRFGLRYSF